MQGRRASSDPKDTYIAKIHDEIESFLAKLRRGKFVTREHQSQSIVAARECAGILRKVVELYHEAETQPHSRSVQSLTHGASAISVSTEQVSTLLRHVTRAGSAMQRGAYFKLLLTNVTRRVLSILRQAAAESTASESDLEKIARAIVEDNHGRAGHSSDGEEFELVDADDDEEHATHSSTASDDDKDMNNDDDDGLDAPLETVTTSSKTSHASPLQPKILRAATARQTSSRKTPTGGMMSRGFPPRAPAGDEHTPSSLLSDFAVSTPPRHVLARAPSILGEIDVLKEHLYPVKFEEFVQRSIDGMRSFEMELAQVTPELCKRAAKQLHPVDTVITLGCSHSTLNFLLKATDDCKVGSMFKVIILEGRPLRGAHKLADALRDRGVDVRVLPDSSAFAVMSTCTKVVIGVENVLANGGLLAPIGTHPLCIAAKHFSVPVMVVTMTLKMTPYFPSDRLCTSLVKISRTQSEELPWSTFAFPGDVLPIDEWADVDTDFLHPLDVANPQMEYVPPQLVSLFATNEGEYTVPQIHRIVRDNYNNEDAHL